MCLPAHGSAIWQKTWIVERTFSWLSRNRRMSKDDERTLQTSETVTLGSDNSAAGGAPRATAALLRGRSCFSMEG